MAVNPYSTQTISGYNASPPPDDGSQTSANKVEWAKHKEKLGDPLKTLAEGINSSILTAANTLALTDVSTLSAGTATIAETDWHNAILALATVGVYYPDPADFENGWHNDVFNGGAGPINLTSTATTSFRVDGNTASGIEIAGGGSAHVINTATVYLVFHNRAPNDAELAIAAQIFRS